jgi:hypothetical protein
MGYSTIQQVNSVIANSLTTGTSASATDDPLPLIQFGSAFKQNLISDDLIYQHIIWADAEIDAALSVLYVVPLREMVDVEFELLANIDEYNDSIEIQDANLLHPGDTIVFIDGSYEERHIVSSVVNNSIIEIQDSLIGHYSSDSTRILRIKYPDPISLISAKYAAASLFDKHFSGASPNQSDYSKIMKQEGKDLLNNVLQGRQILKGVKRIGNRFYESNLDDRYGLPPISGDGTRDLSGGR